MKEIVGSSPRIWEWRKWVKGTWILKVNSLWAVILKRQTDTQASMTMPIGCTNIGNGRECSSEAGLVGHSSIEQGDSWRQHWQCLVKTIHWSESSLGVVLAKPVWIQIQWVLANSLWVFGLIVIGKTILIHLFNLSYFDQIQCSLENLWVIPWLSE